MSANSFGKFLTLTSFGESHGDAIGGVIDGYPSSIAIDLGFVQSELNRRKPGQSAIVTQRKEEDKVEFLSGIFEGKSSGTPIGFIIRNENQKSKDYAHLKDTFRPSHADYTYSAKYSNNDPRGGGRSSARETACRVVAGALAKLLLKAQKIKITAYVSQVGDVKLEKSYLELNLSKTENNEVRCPDEKVSKQMIKLIQEVKKQGDTVGGVITCVIQNMPVGIGEPVFEKLHAQLGSAMLGINAVKGFEYGSGFASAAMKGTKHNDVFIIKNKKVGTSTNFSGGIQGGISNGEDIYFNVAFKPVATIMQEQESIDKKGKKTTVSGKGRHDPCVVPRAVPIVEAMAALVIADYYLISKARK